MSTVSLGDDAGSGVPEEIQERIFDPFFTTKEVGEGTGLRLSVSRQIVSQHEGELALRESSSAGATFEIRLPVYHEPPSGDLS